jgi:Phospholipase_D-nuclease N-terminal
MDAITSILDGLSRGALIAIVVLACLQLVFQAWCLVDLARRTSVLGGRKWIWALVIIFAGVLGAFIYLGLGRQGYVDLGPDRGAGDEDATRRAIDKLYGDKK